MTRTRKIMVYYGVLLLLQVLFLHKGYSMPVITAYDYNVTNEELGDIQSAAYGTAQFFNDMGIVSLYNARVLVATESTYAQALTEYGHMNSKQAAIESTRSGGMFFKNGVVVIKVKKSMSKAGRFFVTAHELTHYVEAEISGVENMDKIYWLTEGTAHAIASKVVENCRVGTVQYAKDSSIATTIGAGMPLDLRQIENKQDWRNSDPNYAYSFGCSAALLLAEKQGYQSLVNYFKLLREYSPENAFQMAFHETYDQFTGEIKSSLYLNYVIVWVKHSKLLAFILFVLVLVLIYNRFLRVSAKTDAVS